MKKINKAIIGGLAVLGVGVTSSAAAAGVVFLPITKSGYELEPTVSLMVGTMKGTQDGAESSSIIGAEFAFRCGLVQMGDNQLRQQLSITNWDKNSLNMKNIELNLHYQMPVAKDVKVGFGPGVGVILTDLAGSDNPTFFGGQLGASVNYAGLGAISLGAEARYQVTNKDSFVSGGTEDNMNNWRVAAKVGYSF